MIKRVAIIGSGALATFYAYKWGEEYNVSVLGSWEDAINGINDAVKRKYSNLKVAAYLNWTTIKEPDLVVWLTKSYKNESVLKQYLSLNWNCPVLVLQNGIGQKELFQKKISSKVIFGVTNQGAKLQSPGNVVNTGDGNIETEEDGLLNGFPVFQTQSFEEIQLKKLAINAVLNPVCALFEVKNGDAVNGDPGLMLRLLVKECFPFFSERAVFASEEDYFRLVVGAAEATAENINSMLSDVLSERKTEINEILGPINQEMQSGQLFNVIQRLS